jgi:pyrimidine-nucleoside phosphorylase
VLVTLHADTESPKDSIEKVKQAYRFSSEHVERPTLIHKVIRD